jgi:two-component system, LytTR family, response regulator
MKKRAIIVDDEAVERFLFNVLCKHCPQLEIVGEADNVKQAAELINRLEPDVVFLDINLDEESGFDLLPLLRTNPRIVFVTLHDRYAAQAFRVNALDYLMKPVELEQLKETMQRLEREIEPLPEPTDLGVRDYCILKEDDRRLLVKVSQVVAICADKDYSIIYIDQAEPFRMRRSLKKWSSALPEDLFISLDRSCIINRSQFRQLVENTKTGSGVLHLGRSNTIEIGRTAVSTTKEILATKILK